MTSKLKCPMCGHKLALETEHEDKLLETMYCPTCKHFMLGNYRIWQALIQAKQDLEFFKEEQDRSATALIERTKELDKCQKGLEILKQALEKYADEDMWETGHQWDVEYIQGLFLEYGYKIAKEALEQIEHKE